MPEAKGTRVVRERLAAAGNKIAVGSDLHLMEMLVSQLDRANRIIGWMMPHIGRMAPPDGGLADLNEHCCENNVPDPGREDDDRPLDQRPAR